MRSNFLQALLLSTAVGVASADLTAPAASPTISLGPSQPTATGNSSSPQMLQLSQDSHFHFELLRGLAAAPYRGSDIGELLTAAAQITPGDFDSWTVVFKKLAERVYALGKTIDGKKFPVSLRDTMFRAATYYRSTDFFLHGNPADPRINEYWYLQAAAFDAAIATLPVPGKRVNITTKSGFYVPAIFYGAKNDGANNYASRKPTFIIGSGYDGYQEELYHEMVKPVLDRGWNAITYEGPGQAAPRRFQNKGFILEWEKVVTPVVDYLHTLPEVDTNAIALAGLSFGGFLAPRAAAYEHRLAALFAIDGLYDFSKIFIWGALQPLLDASNKTGFDQGVQYLRTHTKETKLRWGIDQGLWSWNLASPYDFAKDVQRFTLNGTVQKIKVPTFVGDAEDDLFYKGQPKTLADALGGLATRHVFKTENGEGEHCAIGAVVGLNQVTLDWFQSQVLDKKRN